ncbi:MAG: DNA-directed RNA polymerase subunit alpha [Mycoplasmoidaceae bacterium]
MKKFVRYDIDFNENEENKNFGSFEIKPLEKGFGNTIGNSLRRVLLGNIFGTSIFAIKIPKITHEFQAIEGVYEDVTQIILNLKNLVIKYKGDFFSDYFEKFTIENWPVMKINSSNTIITGNDIQCPPEFEIINKDLYICKLTEGAKIIIDIYASTGRGFVSFSENKEIINTRGIIATDSSFSPVLRVSYHVEEIKVTKTNTYDALYIDVVTNGSIKPSEAITIGSKILIDHYQPILSAYDNIKNINIMKDGMENFQQYVLSIPIEELDLSVRSFNCLKRAGIQNIVQITDLTRSELEKIRNLGKKSLKEIIQKIESRDLKFKGDR